MEREESLGSKMFGSTNNTATENTPFNKENISNSVPSQEPISGELGYEIQTTYTAGTLQEILTEAKGQYAICEFLVGSNSTEQKDGIIFSVGVSYFILYEQVQQEYIICDLYATKVVTIPYPYNPNINYKNQISTTGSSNKRTRR